MSRATANRGGHTQDKAKDQDMTMNSKTITTGLMAALFSLAFSTALLLSAVGPAINTAVA